MLNRLCPLASTARTSAPILQAAAPFLSQSATVHHHKERHDLERFLGIHRSNRARANRNTQHNEKMFRRMRGRKTVLVDLPDHEEQKRIDDLHPSQARLELLKKGINPYKDAQPRIWEESQATMQSFYGVIDPYVSPEDPRPWLSKDVVPKGNELKERGLHMWHNWKNGTSRIKKKQGLEKFDPKTFGETADDIYKRAHEALVSRDKEELHKYITEYAYIKMWPDVEQGSVKWQLVERNEPSRVVSVRCSDSPYKSGNDIAQLTVRMNTKQILAIYDRFGHILLGSETEPRDVIEYVVFENHIAVVDGVWRLHDKVYPQWSKPKQAARITQTIGSSGPEEPTSLPLRAEILSKEQRERDKKQKAEEEA